MNDIPCSPKHPLFVHLLRDFIVGTDNVEVAFAHPLLHEVSYLR